MRDPKGGRAQGNPKTHKETHTMRIIINGRGHPTENMAQYVEESLNDNVRGLKTYIKDSTDFVKKIEKMPPVSEGDLLFCMDVKSLYPSVPRK